MRCKKRENISGAVFTRALPLPTGPMTITSCPGWMSSSTPDKVKAGGDPSTSTATAVTAAPRGDEGGVADADTACSGLNVALDDAAPSSWPALPFSAAPAAPRDPNSPRPARPALAAALAAAASVANRALAAAGSSFLGGASA